MKILVTGGAGYIGSMMTKKLIDGGFEVVVVDNLERGNRNVVHEKALFEQGDVNSEQFMENIFRKHTVEAVIHFAGYISMGESMENPGIYFRNNVDGALTILECMRRHNVNNFIFSSTAGIYGNPTKVPIPEDHPTMPTNPYGESKLMVEKILSWYQKIYDINFVALRYFNAAGAALDGSLGEDHHPETHIIPNIINAALTNLEFTLFGDDYPTPNGTCIRDYIHVIDLVETHLLAFEKLKKENGGFFYNVGTGKGYSNKEVVEIVKKISGVDFKVNISKRRPGDAEILIADPTKIKNELGFAPEHSDLETIVRTAWEWHKKLKMKNEK